ncbi:bactofilin family protein [Gracilimonas mengyeensis]|uniref:Protein CcmA, bactofilin family n=1 Tax=Gracilimonas mengyeensis TaxID=1302730 RepID=A0A521AMJ0_9BACT|nr:polymer-forming cytoskeletal protein [Gracilimonas mengyeensis]SMO36015.1 protein CcmA, bactofilin family [Gracilimonas mengyeensis]
METKDPTKSITQIAEGTTLRADIKTDQSIRIAGVVEGNLHSNEKIILSNTGRLKGIFVAMNIEISGKVEGELHAKEKLTVSGSASIDGQIFAKHFAIEEGATVNADIKSGANVQIDLDNPGAISTNGQSEQKKPAEEVEKAAKKETKEESTDQKKEHKQEEKASPSDNATSSDKGDATSDAEPKDTLTTASSSRFLSDIYIGIPDHGISKQVSAEILEAGKKLMESLGFQLEIFDEPTYAPFFQHLTYLRKRENDKENIYNIFAPGKEALEAVFMKKENDKVNKKVADAAQQLANAIGQVEQIVVIMGQISVVQISEDTVQTVAVEMTSPALGKRLNQNPRFVLKPKETYDLLTS